MWFAVGQFSAFRWGLGYSCSGAQVDEYTGLKQLLVLNRRTAYTGSLGVFEGQLEV